MRGPQPNTPNQPDLMDPAETARAKPSDSAECPVCGGSGAYFGCFGDTFYRVTDYRADLFRCGNCRSHFIWPQPTREAIAAFYPTGYWREREESPGLLARAQSRYVDLMLNWDLMSWVRRMNLPAGARFLDIGCSRGDWLALIRRAGFRAEGIEADPRAAAYARDHHGISVSEVDVDEWSPEPGSYDAISFFHLLEHLRKPRRLLASCHGALRPGGKILLRVPNFSSWQGRLFGARWKGLEIPRHLLHFHPRALAELVEREGFVVERLSTWALRDGPPAAASSLYPDGEPTRREILGRQGAFPVLIYLGLTWMLTPLERLAALCGQGSMTTLIARRKGGA